MVPAQASPATSVMCWARIAAGCALALVAATGSAVAADIVHLSNGDILEGKILEETDRHVLLAVSRGSVWIPRSDVAMIRRDEAATPLSMARLRELADRLKRASAQEEEESAPGESGEPKKVDEKKLKEIRAALAEVASKDVKVREAARNRVRAFGPEAVPVLTPALSHGSTYVRTLAAELLGYYNARESVQSLLMALRGAVPDQRKVRPWQRGFVRSLNASLRRITGQSFDIRERSVNQNKVVDEYVAWWDGTTAPGGEDAKGIGACVTWDTPQVGEAAIAEDDEEKEKKLWEARRVGASRYTYSAPRSFTDGVGGGR